MNRRRFLTHSSAVAGLSWASANVGATSSNEWTAFDRVIFDARFASARRVAAEAAQRGATIRGIAGDMTKLWNDDLDQLRSRDDAHIAGYTTEAAAVQLDWLARERGYELTWIREPYADGSGFGHTEMTSLLSESGMPVRLMSWTITPPLNGTPRWR